MATPASAAPNDTMLTELKALITDLSGTELSDAEPDASFLELGFDSLFLTQLTQGIQSKFRVKLTFRQIMESYPTLGSLTAHLDSTVAPELRATPSGGTDSGAGSSDGSRSGCTRSDSSAVVAPMAFAAVPAPAASYEALFAGQLQALTSLFQQQMAFLQGSCAGRGGFCSCDSYKCTDYRAISNCFRYKIDFASDNCCATCACSGPEYGRGERAETCEASLHTLQAAAARGNRRVESGTGDLP